MIYRVKSDGTSLLNDKVLGKYELALIGYFKMNNLFFITDRTSLWRSDNPFCSDRIGNLNKNDLIFKIPFETNNHYIKIFCKLGIGFMTEKYVNSKLLSEVV